MESLDLNIDNYNLPDILALFNLPTLFNEDDLYDALSEQMDNITSFIEKISKKIENL